MSEQPKKETVAGGFEQSLTDAIQAADLQRLISLFVEIDETLQHGQMLESMYQRPSVSRQNLERDLEMFLKDAQDDSAHYLFVLTGGYNRIRVSFEQGKVMTEMTQNTMPELINKWEEIK